MGHTGLVTALILDRDEKFLSFLTSGNDNKNNVPILCNNIKDAERVIADQNQPILGVFINPNIGATETVMTIRACRQFRPSVPVYFLQDGKMEFEEAVLNRLGIESVLKKPIELNGIFACLNLNQEGFTKDKIIVPESMRSSNAAKKNVGESPPEFSAPDTDFVPVNITNVYCGPSCIFALYRRTGTGRYVKVLQAREALSKTDRETLIQVGIKHLYIEKDAQEKYLVFCEAFISTLIEKSATPIESKLDLTLNFGTEILEFYGRMGVNEGNLRHANLFVRQVGQLIKQIKPERYPKLFEYMRDAASYDHGTGVAFTASLLMQQLDIQSPDPVETIGIASLFHDLGLRNLLVKINHEEESFMSEEEKKIFWTHPKEGADLLRMIPGIKDAALQGIEQHHMRRNKAGFPKLAGAATLGLVGEIVGMSDEICRIIKVSNQNAKFDLNNMFELRVYPAFGHKLVAGFKKMFLKVAA